MEKEIREGSIQRKKVNEKSEGRKKKKKKRKQQRNPAI